MAKSIVVTGGTKGIGRAIIQKFAKEGFDVFTCSRNDDDLQKLKMDFELEFPERKLFTMKADLSQKDQVDHFAQMIKRYGIPDVIVNNT